MPTLLDNVLVVFKKSTYHIYFRENRQRLADAHNIFTDDDMARLATADADHAAALDSVCQAMDHQGIPYRRVYRARHVDYSPYSLVISVGGDGTFIEAARQISHQPILGVNSDPARSVGMFCAATPTTFPHWLQKIADGTVTYRRFSRMELRVNDEPHPRHIALNDILLAHKSPAAMSRYHLQIGDTAEDHRSSGIWVSTPAGSTGAVLSAGGKRMPPGSSRLQYRPRELFLPPNSPHPYQLTGGMVDTTQTITLTSQMREGMVFVDGPYLRFPLPYGNQLQMRRSKDKLRVIDDPA